MPIAFLYRVNGGEVLGVTVTPEVYAGASAYFAVAVDPAMPDGADLAVPKIYDGAAVRNATAGEIAAFAPARAADEEAESKELAASLLLAGDPVIRGVRAAVTVCMRKVNDLREFQHGLPRLTPEEILAEIAAEVANPEA